MASTALWCSNCNDLVHDISYFVVQGPEEVYVQEIFLPFVRVGSTSLYYVESIFCPAVSFFVPFNLIFFLFAGEYWVEFQFVLSFLAELNSLVFVFLWSRH